MFRVGTAFPHVFFGKTPQPASNNFWTKVQLSIKSDAFSSTNIILSLIHFFSTYCTVYLQLRFRDTVVFRTKIWMYKDVVIYSLQTSCLQMLSTHFQCPCDAINTFHSSIFIAFELFGVFVSTRTTNLFGGARESCACFRNNIPFFELQVIFYGQITSLINSIVSQMPFKQSCICLIHSVDTKCEHDCAFPKTKRHLIITTKAFDCY